MGRNGEKKYRADIRKKENVQDKTVKRGLKNKGYKKERQNDSDKYRKKRRKNKQYRRE